MGIDVDASDLARLQYYKVRNTKLSPDEFKFIDKFNVCSRRKGYILSAAWSNNNKNWQFCLIDETERVLLLRKDDPGFFGAILIISFFCRLGLTE